MSNIEGLKPYFEDELEAQQAKRLFQIFFDKIYLEPSVDHNNAFLLSVYMACNMVRKSEVPAEKAKNLFTLIGRPADQFHVYKSRQLEKGNIKESNSTLQLTAVGLKVVKELLRGEFGVKVFLVKAGQTYSGKRRLQEEIFNKLKGRVRLCDPYVDVNTLDYLTDIPNEVNVDVNLLTKNIPDEQTFVREITRFSQEYPNTVISVRLHQAKSLHDRYLVCDKLAVSFGASLKDLGKKDTIVSFLPEEIIEALIEIFDTRWNSSTELI